jgi:hypothetical protein
LKKSQRLEDHVDPEGRVYAIALPVLPSHIERILAGRNIFCKYTDEKNLCIGNGTKVLFYGSATGFRIFGEGEVDAIEFLSPNELIAKYGAKLFISKDELEQYRGSRSLDIKLLVIKFQNVKKYGNPITLAKPITMAGQKFTEEAYVKLISKSPN